MPDVPPRDVSADQLVVPDRRGLATEPHDVRTPIVGLVVARRAQDARRGRVVVDLVQPRVAERRQQHPLLSETAVECDFDGVVVRVVGGIVRVREHAILECRGPIHQVDRRAIVRIARNAVGSRIGGGERHRVGVDAGDVHDGPFVAQVLVNVGRAGRQPLPDLLFEVCRHLVTVGAFEVGIDRDRSRAGRADRTQKRPQLLRVVELKVAVQVVPAVTELPAAHGIRLCGDRVRRGVEIEAAVKTLHDALAVSLEVVRETDARSKRVRCRDPGFGDRAGREEIEHPRIRRAGERGNAVRIDGLFGPAVLVVVVPQTRDSASACY